MNRSFRITGLLAGHQRGDRQATAELWRLAKPALERVARRLMAGERRDHTLQPGDLVNLAFLRMMDGLPICWATTNEFVNSASREMRRQLLDHSRRRSTQRNDRRLKTRLLDDLAAPNWSLNNRIDLEDALRRFEKAHPEAAEIFRMRAEGGFTFSEIAGVRRISPDEARARYKFAQARLRQSLS